MWGPGCQFEGLGFRVFGFRVQGKLYAGLGFISLFVLLPSTVCMCPVLGNQGSRLTLTVAQANIEANVVTFFEGQ